MPHSCFLPLFTLAPSTVFDNNTGETVLLEERYKHGCRRNWLIHQVCKLIRAFPCKAQILQLLHKGEHATLGAFVVVVGWIEVQLELAPRSCFYTGIRGEPSSYLVRFGPSPPDSIARSVNRDFNLNGFHCLPLNAKTRRPT